MRYFAMAALMLAACGPMTEPSQLTPTAKVEGAYYLNLVATTSGDPSVPVRTISNDRFQLFDVAGTLLYQDDNSDGYGDVSYVVGLHNGAGVDFTVSATNSDGLTLLVDRQITVSSTVEPCGGRLVVGNEQMAYQKFVGNQVLTYYSVWNIYSTCSTVLTTSGQPTGTLTDIPAN